MQEAKSSPQQLTYQGTLDRVIGHLEGDDASAAVSAATLCMLLSQNSQPAALGGLAAKLLKLLERDSPEVQRNAVAAFSVALECSETVLTEALEAKAAEQLVARLQQGGPASHVLAANLMAALGALADGGSEGAQSVVAAGGVEALLAWCSPAVAQEGSQQQAGGQQQQEVLQEAAADALCKLAGQGEELRAAAAERGAIPALAALLGASASGEVQVRCLLALGMLVGGSEERQVALAQAPGAAARLVALMRQDIVTADGDCQHIAAGIFAELAKNPAAKESLTAALKGGQQ